MLITPTRQSLTNFQAVVILVAISMIAKPDTVRFTTKGQVVIPLRLRKLYHIENGTRAVVSATEDGILLKPITAALIKRGRGIYPRDSGGAAPVSPAQRLAR